MVFLGIARTLWSRTSITQLASIMKKESACVCDFGHTINRNLKDNHCRSTYTLLRSAHGVWGSMAKRSLVTADLRFAKSKDRGKDKKKPTTVSINLNELSALINVDKLTSQMEKAIEDLKDNYSKNLTLRSTIGSVEQIVVTWEGKEYQLQELAQIARKPKTLVINVSAFPQVIPSIIQAIAKSGMNLNPQQDGTTLFVPIPKVTKEHRENLAKSGKALFIRCRDDIKDIQLRYIKSLKNKTDVSKDAIHNTQNQLQALADKFINEAETIFKMKQKELLGESD